MDDFGLATVTPARARVVRDFATSELFDRTFQEGMELVEQAAAYLDGAGRQESKLLSRNAALAYAATSMRLTTRLMQLASWLLVQRAVREGDMTADEACQGRYRLGGHKTEAEQEDEGAEHLPPGLNALADRAERLFDRVAHLDRRMYLEAPGEEAPNPVLSQFERLQTAFGGGLQI
jgi:regulator of CtrA degradation